MNRREKWIQVAKDLCITQLLLKIPSSKKWDCYCSVLISRVCPSWKSYVVWNHIISDMLCLAVRKGQHKGPMLTTCVQHKRSWRTISLVFFECVSPTFPCPFLLIAFLSQLLTFCGNLVLQSVSSILLLENQRVALSISASLSASGMETSRLLGWASIGQQWESGEDSLLSPRWTTFPAPAQFWNVAQKSWAGNSLSLVSKWKSPINLDHTSALCHRSISSHRFTVILSGNWNSVQWRSFNLVFLWLGQKIGVKLLRRTRWIITRRLGEQTRVNRCTGGSMCTPENNRLGKGIRRTEADRGDV